MNKYKVILVDDHKIFRQGLKELINKGIAEVVAEAGNGKELLDILPGTDYDIILMDISMPVMDGIEATKQVMEKYPETKVLALSMFGDEEYYYQMIHSGVKGFVLKSSGINELENAINEICNGESYFSNELLRKIIANIQDNKKDEKKQENSDKDLSPREMEVLQLICNGLTNLEIAAELHISEATAKGHRTKILNKTNCKNTANLVMYAIKNKKISI